MRLAAVLLIAACSSSAPHPTAPAKPHWSGSLSPEPETGAEVVAEVNGDKIYAADVALQAAAAHQTPAEALAELVDAQLLAQEAFRRGLADDAEVEEARERESVRQLLGRGFEPSFSKPGDIPLEEVRQVYEHPDIKPRYEHEEYHTVVYVRAPAKGKVTPEAENAAREHAEKAHAILGAAKPSTKEDFLAIVKDHPELALKTDGKPFSTSIHGPAQRDFARAAMALNKPGEMSAPVRTPWGFDVLFLVEILPEKHTPWPEAEADIREHWFEPARKRAFERFVEKLLAGHKIVKNEAALEEVQVNSLVGLP